MPKLNKQKAKQAADAESSGFEPLEEGVYVAWLRKVDGDRSGPAGPYWSWEFQVADGQDYDGRRLWLITSLSEAAMFKMNEVFTAYGVPTDTDTDELCGAGRPVRLAVSQRVIEKGSRRGEMGNNIDAVMPFDPELADDGELDDGGDADDDLGFNDQD